ncbi:unnamed protein product [Trifolium pratense]|uniref:Uncharacterized protein n=1 Tax=Trifolium pratense TaxID=57577 RepID=A0ACB0JN00_TRIPR|nr:unnamed protein product [Trifolium pratense]
MCLVYNRGYLCGCELVTAVGKREMSCYHQRVKYTLWCETLEWQLVEMVAACDGVFRSYSRRRRWKIDVLQIL